MKVDQADVSEYFSISLYQMDIERIRYSLTRYLRTRILKIEKNLDLINTSDEQMDRLSYHEKIYATKLYALTNSHFDDAVYSRLKNETREHVYDDCKDRMKDSALQLDVRF